MSGDLELGPMTTEEVADLFGVRTTTVRRWADAGMFAGALEVTLGGHRRFDRAKVVEMKARRSAATVSHVDGVMGGA